MANQTITLGKDVTSIKWVNAGSEFPVEELYLDGTLVWPDANWAKNIIVSNFKYRSGAGYHGLMNYSPYEKTSKRWYSKSGEPWPLSSDHDIYKHTKRAEGSKDLGTQTYYYNVNTSSITPSTTQAEVDALKTKRSWSIKGGTIPANNLPFLYGATKGRATPTLRSSGQPGQGDSTWSSENEGINGIYYPIFYRAKKNDTITNKEEARSAFLYTKNRLRVSTRRPSRSGFYFTDEKQSSNDHFTGVYTNKTSPGTHILLGVYYPSFSESGISGGLDFRFELRVLVRDSEYKFDDTLKSRRDRMDLFQDNIYFEKTLSHPNLLDQTVKRVNIGRFSSPILWTTDSFPDAKNHFYGPIESTFTWEMPIDQEPWMNESFKWKKEGGSWSADNIDHTYWIDTYDINDTSSLHNLTKGFETNGLSITAVQS